MHRVCKALLCAALAFSSLPAAATGIVPMSGTQQFDVSASPPAYLAQGQLFVYQVESSTCAKVYQDFGLTALWPCPILLGADGRIPPIYSPDGSVRLRLTAAPVPPSTVGLVQFDQDNVAIVTAAATSGGTTPVPDSTQIFGTRDVKVRFDDQPLPGYVRLNGRTIGNISSGASERANADTLSLFTQLWGYANISVVGGKGGSAAADWAANKQLTLPDAAGRLLGALDDLGNGPQGRITSATVSGPTVIGAAGGAQQQTLGTPNLPPYTPAGNNAASALTINGQGSGVLILNGVSPTLIANVSATNVAVATLSGTAAAQTFTGTPQGGTSTPVTTMPPVMLFTVYVKL